MNHDYNHIIEHIYFIIRKKLHLSFEHIDTSSDDTIIASINKYDDRIRGFIPTLEYISTYNKDTKLIYSSKKIIF